MAPDGIPIVELLNVKTSLPGEQGEVEAAVNPAALVVVIVDPGDVTGVKGVGAVGPVPVDVLLLLEVELPLPEPEVPELLLLVV